MKKIAGWMAAPAAMVSAWTAHAQDQAQAAVAAGGTSPIYAGVFAAMVIGLIVWFVVALLRAESKRKAQQESS